MKTITLFTGKKHFLSGSMNTLCLCALFLLATAVTACSDDEDGNPTPPPVETPEPEPTPGTTEGNLDEWNWEGENSDKGLVDVEQ